MRSGVSSAQEVVLGPPFVLESPGVWCNVRAGARPGDLGPVLTLVSLPRQWRDHPRLRVNASQIVDPIVSHASRTSLYRTEYSVGAFNKTSRQLGSSYFAVLSQGPSNLLLCRDDDSHRASTARAPRVRSVHQGTPRRSGGRHGPDPSRRRPRSPGQPSGLGGHRARPRPLVSGFLRHPRAPGGHPGHNGRRDGTDPSSDDPVPNRRPAGGKVPPCHRLAAGRTAVREHRSGST